MCNTPTPPAASQGSRAFLLSSIRIALNVNCKQVGQSLIARNIPLEAPVSAGGAFGVFFLPSSHVDQLWYKYRDDLTPTLLAADVKHLIWSCGNPTFGFINSAGEIWIINSNIINNTSLHTISPSDPLTDNFHMLLGGPYKSAVYSDWSIGLVATDTSNDAWLFGWAGTSWEACSRCTNKTNNYRKTCAKGSPHI